jgi:uncharacterized membrane protein YhaH (DUF805 family)
LKTAATAMIIGLAIQLYFTTKGRITRATWWIGIGGLIAWNLVVFVVLWSIFGPSLVLTFFGRLISLCFTVLTIYASYCLSAKRFQDRGRSSLNAKVVAYAWAVKALLDLFHITGNAVPNTLDQLFVVAGTGIGLWYFIALGWMEGNAGPNAYGEAPLDVVARAAPK